MTHYIFSSATSYAEELEQNIDEDVRQCHYTAEQNRDEDRYEGEGCNRNEESQHEFQSLRLDLAAASRLVILISGSASACDSEC